VEFHIDRVDVCCTFFCLRYLLTVLPITFSQCPEEPSLLSYRKRWPDELYLEQWDGPKLHWGVVEARSILRKAESKQTRQRGIRGRGDEWCSDVQEVQPRPRANDIPASLYTTVTDKDIEQARSLWSLMGTCNKYKPSLTHCDKG
jgi:hypothetical protein